MLRMMDKNEVIVLSSDDEADTYQSEKCRSYITFHPVQNKVVKVVRTYPLDQNQSRQNCLKRKLSIDLNIGNKVPANCKVRKLRCSDVSKEKPEIVDLVDCSEKSANECSPLEQESGRNGEAVQDNFKLDVIHIDGEIPCKSSGTQTFHDFTQQDGRQPQNSVIFKSNEDKVADEDKSNTTDVEKDNEEQTEKGNESAIEDGTTDENPNQNLKYFTDFVELCGSLETVPADRVRLTKKLMKRYGEADSSYIKSVEFRTLIEKCTEKLASHNLYLVARSISDELNFRKKIKLVPIKAVERDEAREGVTECTGNDEVTQEKENKKITKRMKFINKICKKLDKLGNKIKELEEEEVDFSDEECSSYVKLQRYRERFCQIYNRLCKYTNDIPGAEKVCNPKICFSGSKYPAIDRCIEMYLNKTKRFPDFTDIMKLLESQSSSLGLPSNKESLRTIAIDIFQEVGAMLQRRRKYELWDSFSGFLDDRIDPAVDDPDLEVILKKNFDDRVKKEQEIFKFYTELQEKERLEPEEVPEDKANLSPTESGSDDEKELEAIENDINKRLDLAIMEETKENDSFEQSIDCDGNSDAAMEEDSKSDSVIHKESKNNFKNCKSLKWRSENSEKSKKDYLDSSTGPENEEREAENEDENEMAEESSNSKGSCGRSKESDKSDSDLELLMVEENVSPKTAMALCRTPEKRDSDSVRKSSTEKKNCVNSSRNSFKQCKDFNRNENRKSNGSFDVHYCQIVSDNAFEVISKKRKDSGKRKVFRDLTNVSRLMGINGKSRRFSELFSPSFFQRSFREFEVSPWKRRFRVSYRMIGSKNDKCALGEAEKTGKTLSSDAGGESEEKEVENNSEGGGDEKDGFDSGHGGESHEDGDEDKNNKNGRTEDDVGENKPEEEEEEEEEEENNTEAEEHSEEKSGEHLEEETPVKTEQALEHVGKAGNTVLTPKIENESLDEKKVQHEEEEELKNKVVEETEKEIKEAVTETDAGIKEIRKTNDKEFPSETEIVESNKGTSEQCPIEIKETHKKTHQNYPYNKEIEETSKTTLEEYPYNLEITETSKKTHQEYPYNLEIEETSRRTHQEYRYKREVPETSRTHQKYPYKTEIGRNQYKKTERKSIPVVLESKEEPKTGEVILIGSQVMSKVVPKKLKRCLSQSERYVEPPAAEAEDECTAIYHRKLNGRGRTVFTPPKKYSNRVKPPEKNALVLPRSSKLTRGTPEDEERVKRFLLHSPSSISITPPRSLAISKPPSQAVLQALATLRNLKGISTTVVKGKPKKEEDVVVIGSSFRSPEQRNSNESKRIKRELPVISSVQSMSPSPRAQGSTSRLQGPPPNLKNAGSESSPIKISAVWGNLPRNFLQIMPDETVAPGCSWYKPPQNVPNSVGNFQKRKAKKKVECVVLD